LIIFPKIEKYSNLGGKNGGLKGFLDIYLLNFKKLYQLILSIRIIS
jgi:hypothetical protein